MIIKIIGGIIGIYSILIFAIYSQSCIGCTHSGEIIAAEMHTLEPCKTKEEILAMIPNISPIYGYYKGETPEEVVLSKMFAQTPQTCRFSNQDEYDFVIFE